LLPGDATLRPILTRIEAVSIHTRRCCRVMRQSFMLTRAVRRFNPHPALLPGDARLCKLAETHTSVSIHTRRCCRVMR